MSTTLLPTPASAAIPAWLAARAAAGQAQFNAAGLPGKRSESWKYTSLEAFSELSFAPAAAHALTRAQAEAFFIPGLDAVNLVFVNGEFRANLSDATAALGPKVVCCTLDEAIARHAALVEPHLGRLSAQAQTREGEAFTALSQAALGGAQSGGLFLHVPEGAAAQKPVHLLSISTKEGGVFAAHGRNLIVAGKGAKASFIEHYVTTDDTAVYLQNAVTEVVAAQDAKVEHYLLEKDSTSAYNFSSLFIELAHKADVHSHTVLLGGKLVRNNVAPTLTGEGAHCLINGLYVGRASQLLDNAMRIHHAAPGCFSRQYYKGILCDQSRGVFTGRIIVDQVAQKTDAIQQSRSMLLSEDARVNTRPQLEIYADDVRCTHGATTGKVDEEAVFYFRSRGIPEPIARAMLVYAFAAEGFDRMELEPVRKLLAKEMIERLPMAASLSIEV